jgi:hypothetical protein
MTATAPPRPSLRDLPVRERLTVRFGAPTAGSAPLTWGQQRVASLNAQLHPGEASLNLRLACRLAPGTAPAEVAAALAEAVHKCEGLRTRYSWNDPDGTQSVCAEGELPCPVLAADGLELPQAFALADDLADAPFRDDDLPIRVALLGDGPCDAAYLLLVVSHLASDFFGIDFLLGNLRAVLPPGPGGAPDPGPDPAQPREIAAWESSPEGLREGRRAVERQAKALARMPQSMLPRLPGEALTPRYRYLELRSSAASLCLTHLSAVHKVSETAVFAATLAALLSAAGGVDRSHLQLCVANRVRGRTATSVASLTQDVPVCVDVTGTDMAGLIRRCAGVVVASTTQGRFPPESLDQARRAVEHDRGLALDLSYWLNSRIRPGTRSAGTPDAARLGDELRRTTVAEVGADLTSSSTVFTYVERDDDELVVRFLVDTAYVATAEAAGWLRAIETMLVSTVTSAAVEPVALARSAGVAAPERNHDWAVVDHSPVHLPTTSRLLSDALGVPVRVVPDHTGRRLLARFDGPPPSEDRLRALGPDLIRGCRVAAIPAGLVP